MDYLHQKHLDNLLEMQISKLKPSLIRVCVRAGYRNLPF